ncbi:MAG: M3 family metallopeptidase [Burkholderiales bacterium]|jgi:oligopeptidase A|nr:M3 family metallopeptidase [Burkholderiales bacterium]
MNPLLDFTGLPRFADFAPEHVAPALDVLLAQNTALIDRLAADPAAPTWDGFVQPLEDANERLFRAWGQVGHMNAVMNSPALREVYNANLGRIAAYGTALAQNEGLFARYKALRASAAFAALSPTRQRVIDNRLRDFRLGGAELAPEHKARFKAISERLAALSSTFSDHVLDATNAFAHHVTDADHVRGIPDDALQAAREAAQADGRDGWKFTLHMPSYLPVMQYAEHRPLRETLYRAWVTRASELGDAALDNTAVIDEILALRREAAALLGYASYAEVSLVPKMAQSPDEVLGFLRDLAQRAKPFAQRDFAELQAFARDTLGIPALEAWDVPWASEKLRVARYAFSDHEVKQYFPEDRVVSGMFRVVETLYGLSIRPDTAPLWHPDVRFFRIDDASGRCVGQFYLDLYARPSKRGGAWMDDAMARRATATGVQTPVAYLNCNFPAPVGGKPATFTHDDVTTLFHEFGHGLHHLLTQVDDLAVSGINGVEWDAVELPSQFMENFCWERSVLADMTRHVDTGAPLPDALYARMVAAKNFQSGMQTVRQIEFALFDMRLHHDWTQSPGALLDAVRAEVAVLHPPAFNRMAHSFSHIFAGGYAAGYYSYKWAEVLSADAFSAFEERGVLDAETGRRFWREILGVGGARPAIESFKAFRGRAPTIDALLRHGGMVTTAHA